MSLSNSVTVLLEADTAKGQLVIQDEGQWTVNSLPVVGPGPESTEIVWQIVNSPGCNFPIHPADAIEFEIENANGDSPSVETLFPMSGRYVVTDGEGNRRILGVHLPERAQSDDELVIKYFIRASGPEGEPLSGPFDSADNEQGRVRSTRR